MAISKTFLTAIQFIESGLNTRTALFSGNVGFQVLTGLVTCDILLPATSSQTLGNVTQMFAIVTQGVLSLSCNINGTAVTIPINQMLILTCSCTNLVLQNSTASQIEATYAIVN